MRSGKWDTEKDMSFNLRILEPEVADLAWEFLGLGVSRPGSFSAWEFLGVGVLVKVRNFSHFVLVWKNEKIKNHYVPQRVSVPRVSRWDLVEFKGRFYPQEVSAPPRVCIGWGDRENPPLLQLKLRTPLQFSCRDLRGCLSTAIMHYHREDLVRFDMHACQNAYCNTEFGIDNIKLLRE